MEAITNAVRNIWENSFCRYALILGAVGMVPFWFLSMAVATIR